MDDIKRACIEAVQAYAPANEDPSVTERTVNLVIKTIINLTPSPRTVDELTRILAEAPADAAVD